MDVWRTLTAAEIGQLTMQHNSADNWDDISVVSTFFVGDIYDCHFSGPVRLGERVSLRRVSLLHSCWLDDDCTLFNVGEIDGDTPVQPFPIDVGNEDGSHTVTAHADMIMADAVLCAMLPHDHALHQLDTSFPGREGYANYIASHVQIRNVLSLRTVWIEPYAVISEAAQLQNVYVHSSAEEPTIVGAGVILRDVVLGYGNVVDTHAIVREVVTGDSVTLTEGLRITHCVVGDNSHLSCCEVLFSLVFPFHEQHHNNSFLIASTVMGQSNLAAGATIGSNHNGRKNDCEMLADRGFWPGLCTSVKFPSRFAAYTLLAKGDYPNEINLPYPFCLLNYNQADHVLEVMPAFWWRYNAYALQRNAAKYVDRDQRKHPRQHVHTQPIAPDTVAQIIHALNRWQMGRKAFLQGVERSQHPVRLLKGNRCYGDYREMLLYYAYSHLKEEMEQSVAQLLPDVQNARLTEWFNLGGQLVPVAEVRELLVHPAATWQEMHARYDSLWQQFPAHNRLMACFVLKYLCDGKPAREKIMLLAEEGREVTAAFEERAREERRRDLASTFRRATQNAIFD